MILRILLGVTCLLLLNVSQAEAQLLRRWRGQPQPQFQPQPQYRQPQPQYRQPQPQYRQPQRNAPQAVAPQNGFQGQLTASQRSRPVYVRRSDGSVVRYYRNAAQQPTRTQTVQIRPTQVQPVRPVLNPAQAQAVAGVNGRPQGVVTVQGQLTPSQSLTQAQPPIANTTIVHPTNAATAVAPAGISVLNRPQAETAVGSISAATTMPEAEITSSQSASSIPVSNTPTNPVPKGLSLSLDNNVAPASADVDIEPTPAADVDSNGKQTFSVLETID